MKKHLITILLFTFAIITFAQNQTTFILVRHAEKAIDGTDNPPLNDAGMERANYLADLLKNQDITALYATPFTRTKKTLQPIADQQELSITEYAPSDKDEWLKSVVKKHAGGTIVISGHSNTIPGLANALLGEEKFEQFDDSDYSNLLIIVIDKVGEGKLVRLKF
ncbi:Broad specificity phosphatase PhoE [Ekhidna lutea]|uniref:Broad specificity phosphatase PhoE n=1 Tax=Ekhidna lutea TaxID=447679 RepID=A0A239IXL8_EKHLU|nr:phosphoglycerate mutase family protein [Ekhidna lutea]SNS98265.1 Broad specificity phosphatase PhoE [Ekhidna lutea]